VTVEAAPEQRNALTVLWDVIVAPRSAFESLRDRPRWLIAFAVTCVLGMIGAFLQIPAGEHIAAATLTRQAATDPNLATMSPEKLQQVKDMAVTAQRWIWPFYPIIVIISISIGTLVMLIGSAIAKGTATFGKLFALSANVAFVNWGIYYLIVGALSTLRGADDFSSQSDIAKLVPSLAWLAPSAGPKLTVFLTVFNPFAIWSFLLLELGLETVASLKRVPAYVVAAVVAFGGILFAAAFAK
jgi:hypothetical protein